MLPETKKLRAYLKYLNENFVGYILETDPGMCLDPPLLRYEVVSFIRYGRNVSNLHYVDVNLKLLTSYKTSDLFGLRGVQNTEAGGVEDHTFSMEDLKILLETGSLHMHYPPEPTSWRVVCKPEETKNEDA